MQKYNPVSMLVAVVNFVFGLAILGLVLRFMLRLFAANPQADFVKFIYDSTAPLLDPFRGIFMPYVIEPGNVLEFSTLFAIMIYLLIAWLIAEFVAYIAFSAKNSYRKS